MLCIKYSAFQQFSQNSVMVCRISLITAPYFEWVWLQFSTHLVPTSHHYFDMNIVFSGKLSSNLLHHWSHWISSQGGDYEGRSCNFPWCLSIVRPWCFFVLFCHIPLLLTPRSRPIQRPSSLIFIFPHLPVSLDGSTYNICPRPGWVTTSF